MLDRRRNGQQAEEDSERTLVQEDNQPGTGIAHA